MKNERKVCHKMSLRKVHRISVPLVSYVKKSLALRQTSQRGVRYE